MPLLSVPKSHLIYETNPPRARVWSVFLKKSFSPVTIMPVRHSPACLQTAHVQAICKGQDRQYDLLVNDLHHNLYCLLGGLSPPLTIPLYCGPSIFTIANRGSYPRSPLPPRPSIIERAIAGWQRGTISDADLERAFQRSMVESVAEQIAAGVEVASDGQCRWDGPAEFILRHLAGFESPPDRLLTKSATTEDSTGIPADGGAVSPITSRAVGRAMWQRPILIDDFKFLSERSPIDLRPTLTGPLSLARFADPDSYCKDRKFELAIDLARALAREIEGLEAAGAHYILIEEPLVTPADTADSLLGEAAAILCQNRAIAVMLAVSGSWTEAIEHLTTLPFTGFAFDLVDEPGNDDLANRPGLMPGRILELGLVSGRSKRIESAMEIGMGLLRFADVHDPDLIWVGPAAPLGGLPRDVAYEKLCRITEAVNWTRREMARREGEPGTAA